jgi:predicted transcriptional regulator
VIKELKDRGPMKKTLLSTTCGLAYDRLVAYLDWMADLGLVAVENDGTVLLTQKGDEAYEKFVAWIMEHVGRLRFPKL